MKIENKTLAEVKIGNLEANIGRLDDVCKLLEMQGSPETIPMIRIIQKSLTVILKLS